MSSNAETFEPTFEPTRAPTPAPTNFPTTSPSTIPSDVPTNVPTASPTHGNVYDYDLSRDLYGAGRIPVIVISMAALHLLTYAIFYFCRSGKSSFWPPKTKPDSPKDKERHMIAKCVLLGGSFLAWVMAIVWTSSCQFTRVGDQFTVKRERIAFGFFRFQDEDGNCASMENVDDPARALLAGRTFAVATCLLSGLAVAMLLLLGAMPLLSKRERIRQRFPRTRLYRLWIAAVSLLYAAAWTSCYSFFFFGLEICHVGPDGQSCKKASAAQLAIWNTVFLLLLTAIGIWHIWDALTPRPMTDMARQNSLRLNNRFANAKNAGDAPQESPRKDGKKKVPAAGGDVEEQTESAHDSYNSDVRTPITPKLPAHKNSVRSALHNKKSPGAGKSPKGSHKPGVSPAVRRGLKKGSVTDPAGKSPRPATGSTKSERPATSNSPRPTTGSPKKHAPQSPRSGSAPRSPKRSATQSPRRGSTKSTAIGSTPVSTKKSSPTGTRTPKRTPKTAGESTKSSVGGNKKVIPQIPDLDSAPKSPRPGMKQKLHSRRGNSTKK